MRVRVTRCNDIILSSMVSPLPSLAQSFLTLLCIRRSDDVISRVGPHQALIYACAGGVLAQGPQI